MDQATENQGHARALTSLVTLTRMTFIRESSKSGPRVGYTVFQTMRPVSIY